MEGKKKEKKEIEEGLFLFEEAGEMPEEERKQRPRIRLIPFSLSDEWYAADIEDVAEVLKLPPVTKVPNLPDYILGVINIRGIITSVADPKMLFGLAETSITPESQLIVVRAARKTTGLLVDSVGKTIALPLDTIQPTLSTIPKIKADYIRGEAKLSDGRFISILDMGKIMSSQQMLFE